MSAVQIAFLMTGVYATGSIPVLLAGQGTEVARDVRAAAAPVLNAAHLVRQRAVLSAAALLALLLIPKGTSRHV